MNDSFCIQHCSRDQDPWNSAGDGKQIIRSSIDLSPKSRSLARGEGWLEASLSP